MKIGLMGPFGFGNLGDAATQDAIIHHLRQRFPQAELIGYSLNPEDTESRHGIVSFAISRQSWKNDGTRPIAARMAAIASWFGRQPIPGRRGIERWLRRLPIEHALILDARRHLSGVDLLVISGGGQIEDYWGGGGPWSYPYTLLKWCTIARLSGAKIAVVSVGAGPIRYRLSKLFLRRALALVDYRSYRDVFSQRLAQSIGVATDNGVFPDLAFSLPLPEKSPEPTARSARRIAIGPIGFMKPDFWPEENPDQYEAYASKLVVFVRHLIDRGDTIVFIPGEAHYDQVIIGEILDRLELNQDAAERIERPKIETVSDLVRELSGVDFVIASRFHNLVLAQMLGKPTLALSYQEKIDSLMNAMGLQEFCFRIPNIDVPTLLQQTTSLEAQSAAIRERLLKNCALYRSNLSRQYEIVFALVDGE